MEKLSPWFPASVKPARKGVYQTHDSNLKSDFYNLWDGKDWYYGSGEWALRHPSINWRWRRWEDGGLTRWRGLATKPQGDK